MNRFHLAAFIGAALSLAACGGGGSAAPLVLPSTLSAVQSQATPAAVATPIIYAALGDSITAGAIATTPQFYYPDVFAAAIGAQVVDLGIGGEFSGPINVATAGGTPLVYGGVLADQVPQIPANANLISLYIGTNDEWVTDNLGADPINSAANVTATIAAIRAHNPHATVMVATVPNATYRSSQGDTPALKQLITNVDDAIRTAILASGAIVVDLQCEPSMYDNANFSDPWNVHPLDSGHAIIAADFLAALHGAQPASSCPYTQSLL